MSTPPCRVITESHGYLLHSSTYGRCERNGRRRRLLTLLIIGARRHVLIQGLPQDKLRWKSCGLCWGKIHIAKRVRLGLRLGKRRTQGQSLALGLGKRRENGQGSGSGGGYSFHAYSCSRKTIDPRIPAMAGRSTSGFFADQTDIACTEREITVRGMASRMKG